MTEVFFGLSVAFVGYAVYVLVEEQVTINKAQAVALLPEKAVDLPKFEAIVAAVPTPTPTRTRTTAQTKKPKTDIASKIINLPEQVGMAAGNVYRFLDKNGAVSVTKLLREIKEDGKTIQRSIGWLAQEGKISLETINRVETIALSNKE